MSTTIDYKQLMAIFKGGWQKLTLKRDYVNSLNVFPVPDGDTGTNMELTMRSVLAEFDNSKPGDIDSVSAAFSKGALNGARGNSGVILSQILRGMSSVFLGEKEITAQIFASALQNGSKKAYEVVSEPKEGTILTVARIVGKYAVTYAKKTADFVIFFQKILKKGDEALQNTPKLLPILEKAGVVDSGAQGLLYILEGMYNILAGIDMEPVDLEKKPEAGREIEISDIHDPDNISFAYCTELSIINMKNYITAADIDKLRDKLRAIGDSVVVVGDFAMIKVHVHTNTPDKVVGYGLALGELSDVKVENMLEQSRARRKKNAGKSGELEELKLQDERSARELERARLERKIKTEGKLNGLLSICSGSGFEKIFRELNADEVLEGGQTMNPSVEDIVEKVNAIGAKNVFVLPNNGNIVLACEGAKELADCNLIVINTENVPAGVAAATQYSPDAAPEKNFENMNSAGKSFSCIRVTHSVKDAEIDDFVLHNGDIIAVENEIIAKGKDINAVVKEALKTKDASCLCNITLYYGEGVTEEEADVLGEELEKEFPDIDVMVFYGGQAHYYYFIGIE